MNQFDLAATALTARANAPIDFTEQAIGTMTLQPLVQAPPAVTLEEPQSLTLALIGAATLLAYRGLKQRLGSMAAPAKPVVSAPRRAA